MLTTRTKLLGEQKAEADKAMLDVAFQETPDYRALVASSDRVVVVGRRGTGKSALALKLREHWERANKTVVVLVAPEEHHSIGLRGALKELGTNFTHVRAGSRIVWKYALLTEAAAQLTKYYKFKNTDIEVELRPHTNDWLSHNDDIHGKLRRKIKALLKGGGEPEDIIAELPHQLDLNLVEGCVSKAMIETKFHVAFIIDKLDEGFEPDCVGVALIDGMLQAIIDLKNKISSFRPVIFLRDNIFRAIQKLDMDFSRNIEGEVLRLHWDEYQLFNLACARLKAAFSIDQEKSRRIWDECTAHDMKGTEGFKKCLHQTLYRPRDILTLLNEAFYIAAKEDRDKIITGDIEKAAKDISKTRLDDLHKEYSSIIPSVDVLTSAFVNRSPELHVEDAVALISEAMQQDDLEPSAVQSLRLFRSPMDALGSLYSIGFVGVKDDASRTFQFCHDGRSPNREFEARQTVLIHPCYWLALNMTKSSFNPEEAEEIYDEYDEYDINVQSTEKEERTRRIGQIMAELQAIPEGASGAARFEQWCFDAVRILFAGRLTNTELHPNQGDTQRRDVVATNHAESPFWRRIREDYSVRQVVFEVKNYSGIGRDEYRQMLSYLHGEYGRLGFIITRDADIALRAGRELDWMRETYNNHKVLIVKISGKYLSDLISKLRNPQKHDASEKSLNGLLDTYVRNYLGEKPSAKARRRR